MRSECLKSKSKPHFLRVENVFRRVENVFRNFRNRLKRLKNAVLRVFGRFLNEITPFLWESARANARAGLKLNENIPANIVPK